MEAEDVAEKPFVEAAVATGEELLYTVRLLPTTPAATAPKTLVLTAGVAVIAET